MNSNSSDKPMATGLDALIATRQSCRAYDPSRPVSRSDIEALVEAARLAPSACNSQTWRFVVVTDKTLLTQIVEKGMRSMVTNNFLKEAPCLIVGCSKLDLIANTFGRTVSGIDYYQVDMGIALEHIALKATELSLGTCWIGWFDEKAVKKILGIPRSVKITALMSVGYPKNGIIREKKRKSANEILFWETWK